jgi:Zn-finger in ubiquitin-hydrolases and other protein
MAELCTHLDKIQVLPSGETTCRQWVRLGDSWVHLRRCPTCGQVGCCDSSKNKHASRHAKPTQHPIVGALNPARCALSESADGHQAEGS